MFAKFALFLLCLPHRVDLRCPRNEPCFPPPINAAKHKSHQLYINSTCGSPSETFCVGRDCSYVCDSENDDTKHPGTYIQDNYEVLTYWKSANFEEPVSIRFDFENKLLLHQITITFQFELPSSLYIQRSQDFGKTYTTLAFFAGQCFDTFGIEESVRYNKLKVLCFAINPGPIQRQISFAPRRNDFVSTEILKGGFVRDYYIASNIRIVLNEFYKPAAFDRQYANKHKFYFSMRDLDIQASCYCNGMSAQCDPHDYGKCICEKNTEGYNCDKCMKSFNNKPWRFGKVCERCNCNNHASDCVYDSFKKYGVCKDCLHDTRGDHCESCNVGYFRNASVSIAHPKSCTRCKCYEPGVLRGSNTCDPNSGKCHCKPNVAGFLCDHCKDGFYGLTSSACGRCLPCACKPSGSLSLICDKVSGICPCKIGFTGRTCSECVVGYYGYPVYNPTECRECGCKPSGSVSMLCDLTGQCTCRQNYYGVKCEQIKIGYYSASVNQLLLSSIDAVITSPVEHTHQSLHIKDASGNTFGVLGYNLGLGGSLIPDLTQLLFKVKIPASTVYDIYLQYITSSDFKGVTTDFELKSAFQNATCDKGGLPGVTSQVITNEIAAANKSTELGSLCLSVGFYDIQLNFPAESAGPESESAKIFIIALLLLPNYRYSPRYQKASAELQFNIQQYYKFASSFQLWPKKESGGAKYLAYIYGSYFTNAFECSCNTMGSINPQVCNVHGGQCNCKKNVYGRKCDRCLPRYYNFLSGLGCDPCNCDLNGSFSKDCSVHTGRCKCKPNVTGRVCDKCKPGFYGLASQDGCKPCNCQPTHTESVQCHEDGTCKCQPGVTGAKCDKCAPGFYQFGTDGCKKCLCNQLGSEHNKCHPVTGSCTCKEHVTGAHCDQCKYGYYGFHKDFPQVCLPCHCNGRTKECDAAKDFYLLNVSTTFRAMENENTIKGWRSVDITGQEVGETSWAWAPIYDIGRGYVKLIDNAVESPKDLFFSAPKLFLGNKVYSYMYYLNFDLTQEEPEEALDYSNVGDVIIQGVNLAYKLVTKLLVPPRHDQNFRTYRVRFYEKHWHKDDLDSDNPTSLEMRETLRNVQSLWIRGKWSNLIGKYSGISNIVMDYSSYNVKNKTGLEAMQNVEYCVCSEEYSGHSCQNCNIGYTKNIDDDPPTCKKCNCNTHARACDPNNGTCINCMHNTVGPTCSACADGFYGNPEAGTPADCKECKCPGGLGTPNQFSNKCVLNTNNPDEPYRCLDCDEGYSGYRCNLCNDGYYGKPEETFGKCKKCYCNGHIDLNAKSNCNTTTGECLRCLYNTIGFACEYCKPGYYGDAVREVCNPCSCSEIGALDSKCHNVTGQCNCKKNVSGRKCDWL